MQQSTVEYVSRPDEFKSEWLSKLNEEIVLKVI